MSQANSTPTFAQRWIALLNAPATPSEPRRPKQRLKVTVLHDCFHGGTYITATGIERMKARRNAYITDTDLLSKTAQRQLKLVRCKGNKLHGVSTHDSKYHVQYNKFAAIRALAAL
jgi:hypothetical protein